MDPSTAGRAAQPSSSSNSSSMKRIVGDFELSKTRIGKGQYGTVYLANRINNPNELVAAKVVDQKQHQNVLNEVYELHKLQKDRHPNILQLLDQQKNNDYAVLFTEYCEGGDLEKTLRNFRSGFEEAIARRLFQQLANGLLYLNEKKVLHRDLKPANLLLTSKKVDTADLRVADLGFAKKELSLAKSTCGTPLYEAPERLKSEEYGFPAEVWAAGLILFEMLFGFHPFAARDRATLLSLSMAANIKFPRPVSDDLRNLLEGMLTPDPAARMSIEKVATHPWVQSERPMPLPSLRHVDPSSFSVPPMHNGPTTAVSSSSMTSTAGHTMERRPPSPVVDPIPPKANPTTTETRIDAASNSPEPGESPRPEPTDRGHKAPDCDLHSSHTDSAVGNQTFDRRLHALGGARLICELALKEVNPVKSIALLCYAASVATRHADVFAHLDDTTKGFQMQCREKALYYRGHIRGSTIIAAPQVLVLHWAQHLARTIAQDEVFDGSGVSVGTTGMDTYDKAILLLNVLLEDDAIQDGDKCAVYRLKHRLDVHVRALRAEERLKHDDQN